MMFKKRVKTAAELHFALTGIALLLVGLFASSPVAEPWVSILLSGVVLLQPIASFLYVKVLVPSLNNLILENSSGVFWSIFVVSLLLIPAWSLFFGWSFIRMKDWLNHFPVFGKRVF